MTRFLVHRGVQMGLLLALLLAAVVFGFSEHRWRKSFQFQAFDRLNMEYPRARSGDVIIVDIDDDSLKALGQWPWPRDVIARLVDRLTAMGAAAIAFDGVLAEPDRTAPEHDAALAASIEKSGKFISAFSFGSYAEGNDKPRLIKPFLSKKEEAEIFLNHAQRFQTTVNFLPPLEAAAAGNGSFMAFPEHDGILRKTSLVFSDGETLYPSLSLESLRVALMDAKEHVRIGRTPESERRLIDTDYRLVLGGHVVPVEKQGYIWVYYRNFSFDEDYISAAKILDEALTDSVQDRISKKIVLIGSSAEGLKDLRNTSLQLFRPGVEIHANAIEQILQDKYLVRPWIAVVGEQFFILCAGLLMIMLAPFVNALVLGGVCLALIAGIVYGSGFSFLHYGVLLDPVYPSLSVLAIFVLSTILSYIRSEYERRQVRTAFGLYISPDFMKELTRHPEKLKLGGEIRDLTILFSDIRNFTKVSEALTPEELIQLMNDFLTPMTDLVMQNRGTIDKYMGDAMMAFWNAPLDDPDHARNACLAALGMQAALQPVNEAVAAKARAAGREPVLLKAGIGINTGPCAVGNMGSRQRFAYSTLGDAVNLASRLEGQTKPYGVGILVGDTTKQAAPDFAFLEIDMLRVKGKQNAVTVWALLGDQTVADSQSFKTLCIAQDNMLSSLRARLFKQSLEILEGSRASMNEFSLAGLYDFYQERLKSLIESTPPEDWDGAFEALSK